MTVTKLLDQVIGSQPNLAKVAQGYGRVATTAHPHCMCSAFTWNTRGGGWKTCPQHVGIRAGTRYAQTVVPPEEMAA